MKRALLAILFVLACATVTKPGLLSKTIFDNENRRAYAQCVQQDAQFPAALKRSCLREAALRAANWEWEKCINDAKQIDCGLRPTMMDIIKAGL